MDEFSALLWGTIHTLLKLHRWEFTAICIPLLYVTNSVLVVV